MLPVTSLWSIMEKGDWNLKEIEDSLKQDSSCVNKEDSYGNMPLFHTLTDNSCPVDVIKLLIKYGANVNFKEESDETPLTAALEASRDETVISLLLENGADVLYEFRGNTLLCIALHNDASKDVIQLLLDAGCRLDACEEHESALHCAVDNPCLVLKEDVLRLLIERGADVNAIDTCDRSVMCRALYYGIEVCSIEILYRVGVSLTACAKHDSPLLCATDFPYIGSKTPLTTNLIKFLLQKGAPLDKVNSYGLTPLQGAIQMCRYETDAIKFLLHHLPDMDVVDHFHNNLLGLAVWNFHYCDPHVVKLLIERGVRVDNANVEGVTTLHHATDNDECCLSVIKLLLKNGAAVNARDHSGKTALELHINNRLNYDKIRVLLAAGAHVEVEYGQPLLKRIIDTYENNEQFRSVGLGYFQILLKYSLLQNPNFRIEDLVEGCKDHETFSKYWGDCVNELRKMECVFVGEGCTLIEFLKEYSTPRNEAANCKPQVRNYDFNQLLKIKANNVFQLFSDVLSDKVDRWIMNMKLPEVRVHTIKYTPHKACEGEKIFLDYGSVLEIVQYLPDDDLFRLIVAFTFMDGHASSGEDRKEGRNK